MKYFLSFFIIGISFNVFAQSTEYSKPEWFLKIQGGLVYDSRGEKDYVGFNYLNLGLFRLKDEKIDGIELDLMAFDQVVMRNYFTFVMLPIPVGSFPNTAPVNEWSYQRKAVDLSVFRTYLLLGNLKSKIYLGPFISANYIEAQLIPLKEDEALFPRDLKHYGLSVGGKLDYYVQITEKINAILGLKFNVVSYDIETDHIDRPEFIPYQGDFTSFNFGLFKGKVPLMIGLDFSI